MKLLITDDNNIAAVVYDFFETEELTVPLPEGFDTTNLQKYCYDRETGTVKLKVPKYVTLRQARLALLAAGLYSSVNTALNSIPDENARTAALIEWEYAITVDRNSTLVNSMKVLLGLTDTQLDQLFITASSY